MVGNLVEDRRAKGWEPGGPALFAARTAWSLGAKVTVVTRQPRGFARTQLEGLDIISEPSAVATRYDNRYLAGRREQWLVAAGESIDSMPAIVGGADGVIFAPAYQELDELGRAGGLSSARAQPFFLLQGTLRDSDLSGRVVQRGDLKHSLAAAVPRGGWAFYSREDTADPAALARWLARRGVDVVVTNDVDGACLYHGGESRAFGAAPAHNIDPTGAGDCFAAAFAVRLIETHDVDQAMRYGLVAGALAVEGEGLEGVPTRAGIEARLAEVPV